MCVAASSTAVFTLVSAALGAGASIVTSSMQKKTEEYKTQIALNQVKSAQNEAQRQRQLGIEEARQERIEGLKNISRLQAQNASNGFDTYSQTNMYNYEDVDNEHESNAQNILDSYYARAQGYDEQAQRYMDNLNVSNMNKDLQETNNFFTSLGNTKKAAQKWYDNNFGSGGVNGNF